MIVTKRQKEILDYLSAYKARLGYSPTLGQQHLCADERENVDQAELQQSESTDERRDREIEASQTQNCERI